MKDSALAKRLASIAKKYVDDDDMLEELGTKSEIERYVWSVISEMGNDDEVDEIAFAYMKSHVDKHEFFQFLNTNGLAERAKRIRKERPLY